MLERLGSEYSSKLVSKIVISSNERMVEPAPLDVPKSATQIMLGTRNAELWLINIHISFSFSSLPTYPISSTRPPEKQLINLQWPKVVGHPVRSAARLCVENEWEIASWICPYHQNVWQKLRPKFKQIEVWDCPHTSLAASC